MADRRRRRRRRNLKLSLGSGESSLSSCRSSLKVNLSYVSNLSDSGNESLCTSQQKDIITSKIKQSDVCADAVPISKVNNQTPVNRIYNDSLAKINEKVLSVILNRIPETRLNVSMESLQSSIPDDIGVPVTCSSFISNRKQPTKLSSQQAESDSEESSSYSDIQIVQCPKIISSRSVAPMEITASSKVQKSSQIANESNITPMETTDINEAITVVNKKCFASQRRSTDIMPRSMELTSIQTENLNSSVENDVAANSINVNTSASVLAGSSRRVRSTQSFLSLRNHKSTHVSLRVNTSVETQSSSSEMTVNNETKSEKSFSTSTDKDDMDSSNASHADSLENMSLIERMKHMTVKRKESEEDNVKSNQSHRLSNGEGPSFVEGTPYPASRSVLWKTQIRYETLNAKRKKLTNKSNMLSNLGENSLETMDSDLCVNASYFTPPSRTLSRNVPNPQIIQESSIDESGSAADTSIPKVLENTTRKVEKPRRRKLFSPNNNFDLVSFTPMSASPSSPNRLPIMKRRRKKFQKRNVTCVVAGKRNETTPGKKQDESTLSGSSNDICIPKEKTKVKKPRKVISKKIVVKKTTNVDILEQLEASAKANSNSKSAANVRSSSGEFSKRKMLPFKGRNSTKKLIIVATGFAKGDVDLVKSVIKELGGAEINNTVTRHTTHVVSTGVRTINLLRGIIRGCWLVGLDWVLHSLEHNKWLDAHKYEMVHFSKAVKENRRDRQLFGKCYVPELFTTCGCIYIQSGTSPPPTILKELVKTAGGKIIDNPKQARFIIGKDGLREIWIIDSITTGKLQSTDEYLRK